MARLPFLSYDDIIDLAACHTCCAMRKEPCSFTRTEDPTGVRQFRRQSHDDRVIRARKIFDSIQPQPIDIRGFVL